MTGIKDRRGVSNFYLTLYMSSAPSRTHSGTVAPGPSWPMYKPFAWPSSSHRSNPLAVGNEMKPSSAPAVMLVNGTSSCSGGNLVHDLTSVETKVMESYCQGYQLLCSSLAGGHRWKPAVANGGNTDERARANWTELCWGDYAVHGQGTTAVYLRCVA